MNRPFQRPYQRPFALYTSSIEYYKIKGVHQYGRKAK